MISKRKSARKLLTDEQLKKMCASDFVRIKLTPGEMARLREINSARRQEVAETATRSRDEEVSIVAELRSVGVDVKSVWDLVNTRKSYTKAIPVLLRRLLLPYSDRTREGIARSLAVPDPRVRQAWATLADEYRKVPIGSDAVASSERREQRRGVKDGLACALSVAVTKETLPELIELAKDRAQGESRLLLLSALRKRESTNALAKRALDKLADDPDLSKEIASWGRRSETYRVKRSGR